MNTEMLNSINLIDASQIQDWENIFRVVGVKRCEMILVDIGLPKDIANSSKGLIEATRYFWQTRWAGVTLEGRPVGYGYSDPEFPENYRLGLQLLLNNTLKIIFDSYGRASVFRFNSWAQRHFTDKNQFNCLYIWSHLLYTITDKQDERDKNAVSVPLPFHEDTTELIITSINNHLGIEKRKLWDQKIEEAKKIPLSLYEKKIVELEAVRPTDISEFDVLGMVRTIIENQHIYQFWQEVGQWMTKDELDSFLWWGYEQAKRIGLPIEEVVLPDLEKIEEGL